MSEVTVDQVDLVSPRNCVHCGQALMTTATVDSTDLSASDTDNNRADEAASSTVEHRPRVVVSDPSLVSSRSSTPRDRFVPPPAPLTGSDDECASLLSSDVGGYASSDDLDSEYVSAMEVPVEGGRESVDSFNEVDEADAFGSSGYDNASEELEARSADYDEDDERDDDKDGEDGQQGRSHVTKRMTKVITTTKTRTKTRTVTISTYDKASQEHEGHSVDDHSDDDNEDAESVPQIATMTDDVTLQESSNSASTLLEDPDEPPPPPPLPPRSSADIATQSSSDDDSDDDEGQYRDEMTLLAEASDDADGEDGCLVTGNDPIEPLLAAAGESDLSDAN